MTLSNRISKDPVELKSRLSASPQTILLLATLAAVGQLASNIYTPSLPSVARDFSITDGASQTTLAVFLGAFALSQLLVGPIADKFGRKPTLLVGLAIFLVGTILCGFATDLAELLTGRIIQGSGAAAGVVVSRAATRDCFEGPELTKILSAITIVFALVPGLTPLIGGIVEQLAGWQATFWLTGFLAFIVLLFAAGSLPETLVAPQRFSPSAITKGYATILVDPIFLTNVLAVALAFASMSAFFAGSPVVLIGTLGISPVEYGFYPPIAVSGFVIGGIATRSLATKASPRDLSVIGATIMLVGAALIFIPPSLGLLDKFMISAAMIVHVTGLGILLPASIAAALQRFPERAGTAAAMQGFLQMTGGAVGAASVSLLSERFNDLAFPAVMLGATGFGWLVAVTLIPRGKDVS